MQDKRAWAQIEPLLKPLTDSGAYKRLMAGMKGEEKKLSLFGMPENAKVPLILSLFYKQKKSVMIVTAGDFAAQKLYAALQPTLGEDCLLLPQRTVQLGRARAQNKQTQGLRAKALSRAVSGAPFVLVAGVDAARARLSPPEDFKKHVFTLQKGQRIEINRVTEKLVQAGYQRNESVQETGQFSVRGGIVDVFGADGTAVRIDFFGDEIDQIRKLDILSQRSQEEMQQFALSPAVETPLTHKQAQKALLAMDKKRKNVPLSQQNEQTEHLSQLYDCIAQGDYTNSYEVLSLFLPAYTAVDYLPEGSVLMLDEPIRLSDAAHTTDLEIASTVTELKEKDLAPLGWEEQLAPYIHLTAPPDVLTLSCSAVQQTADSYVFGIRPAQSLHGRFDLLADELAMRNKHGYRTVLALQNEKRCQTLYQSLLDRDVSSGVSTKLETLPGAGHTVLTVAPLGCGFEMADEHYLVLSEQEIFRGQSTRTSTKQKSSLQAAMPAVDLKVGDYAVHDVHGIGIYKGLTTITVEGKPKDFMLMEYRGGDKLYIPADQADRLQKYIGNDDTPKVNKMGGAEWEKAKKKVSRSVKKLAQDLVSIYAARQAMTGYAFSADTAWQNEFEQAFSFEETEGQLQSVEEIKRDMESSKIMDRLLCGDVGYGKTEVAMRAIFKCVMDAKQAMVLVPTTILAQQHYATMAARFEGYPIRVQVLSRFRTQREQKQILQEFADGKIDVLIGTHRLLAKDVKPHDLGLLVVDEEQRFGVGHKETIKDMKRSVDVLTMTATPIPRTMEMSLVGIRDMSVIHTPPEQRFPVNTYVAPYDPALVREAIERELARDGQVYVLYNHVQKMEWLVRELQQLVPQARFVMGHGQMTESQLESAMLQFYEQEADVLVCSTIVENGVDIPTANTMIVLDADHLGLAQLYQLRGRVGRSTRTAYCYMLYEANKQISETAQKRLDAIKEFTDLGSGFRIAMRDLEIRGAGNLLGPEQHGHMANVGYDTYCKLLADAVKQARGETVEPMFETTVDIPLAAYLPEKYVSSKEQKVQVYRKIANIASVADAADLENELQDRFGPIPEATHQLIEISLLRALAHEAGVASVTVRQGQTRMKFAVQAQIEPLEVMQAAERFGPGAQFTKGESPGLLLKLPKATAEEMTTQTMAFLKDLTQAG